MTVTVAEVQEVAQHTSRTTPLDLEDVDIQASGSLKRKRDDDERTTLDLEKIHIRPYHGSIYDKPLLLVPLRIIPRSRLPLTFLDTATTVPINSSGRLFTANIIVLEEKNEDTEHAQVLIGSIDDGAELYAVERVKPRTYALCKLCSWVRIGYLADDHTVALNHIPTVKDDTGKWWDKAVLQPATPAIAAKRLKLSMKVQPKEEPKLEDSSRLPMPTVLQFVEPVPDIVSVVEEAVPEQAMEAPKTCDEIYETLIRQYLEAVYISKTSLAFFAKGPLSRARNAFMDATNPGTMVDLVAQLRSMLLSMAQTDKKYNEKLPEAIKGFPAHSMSDDELDRPLVTKKRKSKKVPKLSREGYYSVEDDYCKRWWSSDRSAQARARSEETFELLQRRRIGDLRRRETLAQITLILEIMALESLPDAKIAIVAEVDSQTRESQIDPAVDSQAPLIDEAPNSKKPKRKQKKQQDLALMLDLLLDKLSIWQSIEQDITGAMDIDKKRDTVAENNEKLQEQDILVGFCTDVVIPFYKSRIPVHASLVNKKLGGPGAVSPAKQEKTRSGTGAMAAPRPGDRRSRKPLQKTLSDTNEFIRSRPPSLVRSATDTQGISRFKREASELSLFDIPPARPQHSGRDSSSQLRHLQRQQVDLTAISVATESKVKKNAQVERELKEVIDTIKRPNRPQAMRDLADAADKRSLGSASMRKRTMAPVKKVLQNVRNVQVTATPKHRRGFNAFAPQKVEPDPEVQEPHAPSSGDFCVPSSGVRAPNPDMVGATPAVLRTVGAPKTLHTISATPSRRAIRLIEYDGSLDELHATPARAPKATACLSATSKGQSASGSSFGDFVRAQMSRAPAASTPMKASSRNMVIDATPMKRFPIFDTPAKKALPSSPPEALAGNHQLENTSAPPTSSADGAGVNIYDALGWNDYVDE